MRPTMPFQKRFIKGNVEKRDDIKILSVASSDALFYTTADIESISS
jgi:hypothetical protein